MQRHNFRWLVGLLLVMTMGLVGQTPPVQAQTQAVAGEFIYVLEDSTSGNRIHRYRLDAATGRLTSIGAPVATGYAGDDNENNYVQRLAYHMPTHRLFVIHDGASNLLSVYQVDTMSGALTPETTVSLGAGSWGCVAVHPSGSPVVVGGMVVAGNGAVGRMHSFVLDADGLHQAPGSPADAGAALPYSCRFSQNGQYLYTGGYGATTIAGFQVDAGNGAISPLDGSPFNAGVSYPNSYATDAQGRLFVADSAGGQGRLNVFTTNNGIPTQVNSGPFNFNQSMTFDGLLHPDGYYIVATMSGLKIYQVSGSGNDTLLAALNSPIIPTDTYGPLALSQDSEWVFASNLYGSIYSLLINPNTGTLNWLATTNLDNSSLISGMVYASAPPPPPVTQGYLYVLRNKVDGNLIYGYQVDQNTGRLTLLDGFPIPTGGAGGTPLRAKQLDFDRSHGRLYALNDGSDTLSVFDVNLFNGTLSPVAGSPFALESGEWTCVKASPLGSPVVAVASNKLISFRADTLSITQASATAISIGGIIAEECAFGPDGQFLYLTGPDIGVYRVNAADGTLSMLPGSPFYSGVGAAGNSTTFGLSVDPENRLLLGEEWTVTGGWITANHAFTLLDGRPTAVMNSPFIWPINMFPVDAIYHPAGYYIVGNQLSLVGSSSTLDVFRLYGSGSTSSFTFIPSTPPGQPALPFPAGAVGLRTLTLDHTGRTLFVANDAIGSVSSFRFDPATGTVQGLSTLSPGSLGGTSIQITGLAYANIHRVFLPLIHIYTAKKIHSK